MYKDKARPFSCHKHKGIKDKRGRRVNFISTLRSVTECSDVEGDTQRGHGLTLRRQRPGKNRDNTMVDMALDLAFLT